MKTIFIFSILFIFCFKTNAQFNKHEKFLGGSFEIFTLKEKNTNTQGGGGSPFPGYAEVQNELRISPEFGYTIKNNIVVSIFGSYLTTKYVSGSTTSKGKGIAAGVAFSKYKFFIKGFGMLLRLQGSYSPSWFNTYQGTNLYKNTFYLTNIGLNGGIFYRFGKHFTSQVMLGRISYDHLVSRYQGDTDSKIQDRFNAGFYKDINLSLFYVFNKAH